MNNIKSISILILLILCTVATTFSQSPSEEINNYLKEFKNELQLSSISVAIVGEIGIVYKNSFGNASQNDTLGINSDNIYPLGSISKLFTATCIVNLLQDNKIRLDDDINNYLPFSVRNPFYKNKPISFRMLLTHTSSIADRQSLQNELYAHGDPEISLQELNMDFFKLDGKYYSKTNFSNSEPGSSWHYSNWNYVLLGYLVERISGDNFNDYSTILLLKPLDMHSSGWLLSDINTDRLVPLYKVVDTTNKVLIDNEYSWPGYSDGGLRTNLNDIGNFIQMMLNEGNYNGKQIVEKEVIDNMLSFQKIKNMPPSYIFDMGLGWHIGRVPDTIFVHSGSPTSSSMYLLINPKKKFGFVSFITGINMKDSKIERAWINHLKYLIKQSDILINEDES